MTATTARGRALSGLEFAIGAGVVLAHNVWDAIPNEVPILVILGLVSIRVRDGGWRAIGFRRPRSWALVIGLAVAAAALRLGLGELVVAPLTALVWPPEVAPSGISAIGGNPVEALKWLLLVWTFAAFGEEVAYRGYLTTRGAQLLGDGRLAWWAATLAVAVLFGFGHWYKGPAGVVDSAMAGLILGAAYQLSGRCLWTAILAHGLIDTTAIVLIYTGLAD